MCEGSQGWAPLGPGTVLLGGTGPQPGADTGRCPQGPGRLSGAPLAVHDCYLAAGIPVRAMGTRLGRGWDQDQEPDSVLFTMIN